MPDEAFSVLNNNMKCLHNWTFYLFCFILNFIWNNAMDPQSYCWSLYTLYEYSQHWWPLFVDMLSGSLLFHTESRECRCVILWLNHWPIGDVAIILKVLFSHSWKQNQTFYGSQWWIYFRWRCGVLYSISNLAYWFRFWYSFCRQRWLVWYAWYRTSGHCPSHGNNTVAERINWAINDASEIIAS